MEISIRFPCLSRRQSRRAYVPTESVFPLFSEGIPTEIRPRGEMGARSIAPLRFDGPARQPTIDNDKYCSR